MKYLALAAPLLLLMSCSSLMPSLPKMTSSEPAPAASTKATQVMAETTANVWEWAWISIVLVFVFPSMRAPITGFLKALFFILALPLELAHKHLTMLYNRKYSNEK